jgi:hypothetical protein
MVEKPCDTLSMVKIPANSILKLNRYRRLKKDGQENKFVSQENNF